MCVAETAPSGKTDDKTTVTTSGSTAGSSATDTPPATITGDPEAPTIELNVYMGPEYNAADDVCFYRIEAIVTGNPMPTEADFSKDDSNKAWGLLRAQVNLTRAEPDYTLTASVTTSSGTAEDSIDLSWDCDGEEPGPEPEPEVAEEEISIDADTTKCGFISEGAESPVSMIWHIYVGDNLVDRFIKAYMTFSLSHFNDMEDVTITEVEIRIPEVDYENEPWNAGSELWVRAVEYGDTLEYPDDFEIGGEIVKVFSTSDTIDNLSFSTEELKNELQGALSEDKESFQLEFSLIGKSDNEDADYYHINASSAEMYVKYVSAE